MLGVSAAKVLGNRSGLVDGVVDLARSPVGNVLAYALLARTGGLLCHKINT